MGNRFNRPVTVVRKKTRPPALANRAQIHDQDQPFSGLRRKGGVSNLAVRLLSIRKDAIEVEVLSPNGPLVPGDGFIAHKRPNPLKRRNKPSGKESKPLEARLEIGDIVDLHNFRLHEDGTGSYRGAELIGPIEEIEDGSLEVQDRVLVSIRSNVAMAEGDLRPEVFMLRPESGVPIRNVLSGLDDMVSLLAREEGYGAAGFLLRGRDLRSGKRYGGVCTLTLKDRKQGLTADDVLGDFLREEVPSLSKMIREAGKREPWQIIPVDVCTTTQELALKAVSLTGSIPFNREIDGENLWFALATVNIEKIDDKREIAYIRTRSDNPVLVGKDFPDGDIEADIEPQEEASGTIPYMGQLFGDPRLQLA